MGKENIFKKPNEILLARKNAQIGKQTKNRNGKSNTIFEIEKQILSGNCTNRPEKSEF